jgi:hypothetical protein
MEANRCKLCNRILATEESAGLARDCGGDCWGCIGEIEADMGYAPSVAKYNLEVEQGLRHGPKKGVYDGGE